MYARDLMTRSPALILPDDTVTAAAGRMRLLGVGILPVVRSIDHPVLVGVITDRDIVVRHVAFEHGGNARIRDHMTPTPLITVSPNDPLRLVAERMRHHQVRRLPVVADDGTVVGIIAQADLALHAGPSEPWLVEQVIEGISRPGALVH